MIFIVQVKDKDNRSGNGVHHNTKKIDVLAVTRPAAKFAKEEKRRSKLTKALSTGRGIDGR
jgi:hypothetical protein